MASASPGLELPGLPGTAPPPKKEPVAVASSSGTPPPAAKEPGKPVAVSSTPPKETGKQVASSGSPPKERRPVPEAVIAQRPPPSSRVEAGGGSNVLGYVAAGAAVVGLGVGGFGFLQSSSAHSDLTGTVHDSATAQSLLDKEKSNKTLSFIGLASGLVFAGVATAFFAF